MSFDPSASSVPDSSWNSSTTPSTKLKTVKPSLTAILNPNKEILNAFVSISSVGIEPYVLSPLKNTPELPGADKADTFTLLAVVIVASLLSAIAADGLTSAFAIVPSAIFAEVTASSANLAVAIVPSPTSVMFVASKVVITYISSEASGAAVNVILFRSPDPSLPTVNAFEAPGFCLTLFTNTCKPFSPPAGIIFARSKAVVQPSPLNVSTFAAAENFVLGDFPIYAIFYPYTSSNTEIVASQALAVPADTRITSPAEPEF